MIKRAVFSSLILVSMTSQVLAYIDPGTGMAFAAGLGAWILAGIAFLTGLVSLTFKKWIGFIKKIFSFSKKHPPSGKKL